jgi:hypothetical protein
MCIEQFHQLSEVGQRSRQAIDLVDDNNIKLPRADIQTRFVDTFDLERRPLRALELAFERAEAPGSIGRSRSTSLRPNVHDSLAKRSF